MNYTEEERKQHIKFNRKVWLSRPDVKEKRKLYAREYNNKHREEKRACERRFYERNKTQRIASINQYNRRPCRDPVLQDIVAYNTLINRRRNHPDIYAGTPSPRECLIHIPKIKGIEKYEAEMKEKDQQQTNNID